MIGENSGSPVPGLSRRTSVLDAIVSGDEGDIEETVVQIRWEGTTKVRDFENEGEPVNSPRKTSRDSSRDSHHKFRFKKRKHRKHKHKQKTEEEAPEPAEEELNDDERAAAHRVGFAPLPNETTAAQSITTKNRAAFLRPRPGLPKLLSQNVFVDPVPDQLVRPRAPRASSLPDLSRAHTIPGRGFHPSYVDRAAPKKVDSGEDTEDDDELPMSRTAAVIMLLVSTGLVALCAEFLVDAIPEMTTDSNISQAFIGLIILPIVGNAAEHVTAVTVAAKNKMDLAIGVAVGSSIQIGLFLNHFDPFSNDSSALRHASGGYSGLDDESSHVALLHLIRNNFTICDSIRCQFPCPRWKK